MSLDTESSNLSEQVKRAIYFEDDKTLVVPDGYTLPPICIRTGKREGLVEIKKRITWNNPGVNLILLASFIFLFVQIILFIIGIPLYFLVSILTAKKAIIKFYVESSIAKSRSFWIILNIITFISALYLFYYSYGIVNFAIYMILGALLIIISLLIFINKVRYIYPKKINEGKVSIQGISKIALSEIKKDLRI